MKTVLRRQDPPPGPGNTVLVALGCLLAVGGAAVFAVGLVEDWPMAAYGLGLAAGMAGLSLALRRAFAAAFPSVEIATPQQRPDGGASEQTGGPGPVGRRGLLVQTAAAGALLALALLAPLRSLARPRREVPFATAWEAGRRLVDDLNRPILAAGVPPEGVATVWPEGVPRHELAAVILVRLPEGPREGIDPDWVVDEHLIAYSKICTHMGCPIGLFRALDATLFCPCHQAQFDAALGARPSFGPAPRPLPQLPIGVDEDGYLVAIGDFTEHVGPAAG